MKLMSYVTSHRASFGIVEGECIYDLGSRLGDSCADLKTAIRSGALKQFEGLAGSVEADFRLGDVVNLPVIPNPGKIICVGLNYAAHREEVKRAVTTEPTMFVRFAESQCGHERPLVCPRESDAFDYEGEIAVIIGKGGRRIAQANALEHVAGLACYNDGSIRDWQAHGTQWTAGKNFPATGAFGPWMVTADELPADNVLSLTTRLNGEQMQHTTTDLMLFPIAKLIEYISTYTTLEAGDVILTGTPGGVGFRREPPVFMKDGDIVEIEVSGIGVLRNRVVKEA
ncbi:Ureidoglycolate lyase [compost metagenome]